MNETQWLCLEKWAGVGAEAEARAGLELIL